MNIETVPIDSISLDPANVRMHPERNLEALRGSLRRFGQQKPILVDGQNVVVAGNGTLQAARDIGWTEIQIVRTELNGVDRTAYAIADNHTGDLSEFSSEVSALVKELAAVPELDLHALGLDALMPVTIPDFGPDASGASGRLDQKTPITCPSCGHVITDY